MTVSSLNDLKKNITFMSLNHLQSQCDATDPEILNDQFTRSSVHAIQFLIAYAGLNEQQRQQVVTRLNSASINQEQIDTLVNDINWEIILKAPAHNSTLQFTFSVALANKSIFLNAIQTRCPHLYQAIIKADCIVSIKELDQVIFTTKIAQTELWAKKFTREDDSDYWGVEQFKLSPQLKRTIDILGEGKRQTIDGFTIKKGTGSLQKQIELRIRAPRGSNEFPISSKIATNPGIYDAFIGLTDFYGLYHVDGVLVELENAANFSDIGAFASQTQIVTCYNESAFIRTNDPTVITVDNLNVFFSGADIMVNFTKDTKKADRFEAQLHIEILTQSEENTHIYLFSQAPKPIDAFILSTQLETDEPSLANASFRFYAKAGTAAPALSDELATKSKFSGCVIN